LRVEVFFEITFVMVCNGIFVIDGLGWFGLRKLDPRPCLIVHNAIAFVCDDDREYFMDVLSRRGPPPGSDPDELRRYRERRARGRRERKAARTLVFSLVSIQRKARNGRS